MCLLQRKKNTENYRLINVQNCFIYWHVEDVAVFFFFSLSVFFFIPVEFLFICCANYIQNDAMWMNWYDGIVKTVGIHS